MNDCFSLMDIPFSDIIPKEEQVRRRNICEACIGVFWHEDEYPSAYQRNMMKKFVQGKVDIEKLAPGNIWKKFLFIRNRRKTPPFRAGMQGS